ncbi:MAG: hypothetical protein AAGL89_00695 [Pseudomonadota bacterium]
MADLRKFGMAGGTFAVALGIGFVMQNGDALANRFSADPSVAEPTPFLDDSAEQPIQASLTEPEAVIPVEETPFAASEVVAAADTQANANAIDEAPLIEDEVAVAAPVAPEMEQPMINQATLLGRVLPDEEPPLRDAPSQLANLDLEVAPEVETDALAEPIDCVPEMMAQAGPAALVKVAVSAPCYANAPFTTHHQGMMFTVMTDENGEANFMVPALAETAVIIAAFDNGDGGVATVMVPDFNDYDRAVLQWQGPQGVMLNAYENEAAYGSENHIYAANPGSMSRLNGGDGGFLMSLGDADLADSMMAEVYTFPSGMAGPVGSVVIAAEAEVTDANCESAYQAQSIQVSPAGEPTALDLEFVMPDCDAVGDFVILQNMFEDLTLAAR